MNFSFRLQLLFTIIILMVNPVISNFYDSISGYACNQPSLYQACGCQSFCQPYMSHVEMESHGNCGHCGGGCGEENEDECGMSKRRRKHRKRKNKKKKKFRFEEEEEEETKHEKKHEQKAEDDEEFPLPPTSEEVANSKKSKSEKEDWEDDDKWESKFVSRPQSSVSSARTPQRTSSGLGGLGLGNGGLFGISSGVGVGVPGVGPIGVSSGLGIG